MRKNLRVARFLRLACLTLPAIAMLSAGNATAGTIYAAGFKNMPENSAPADFKLVTGSETEIFVLKGELRMTRSSEHLLAECADPGLSSQADYTVTARLRFGRGEEVWGGVVARVTNEGSFYHARIFTLADGKAEFQLYRVGGPGTILLGKAEFDFQFGVPLAVELTVKGSTQQARLSDAAGQQIALLEASDGAFVKGTAGLRARPKGSVVVCDEFTVEEAK